MRSPYADGQPLVPLGWGIFELCQLTLWLLWKRTSSVAALRAWAHGNLSLLRADLGNRSTLLLLIGRVHRHQASVWMPFTTRLPLAAQIGS